MHPTCWGPNSVRTPLGLSLSSSTRGLGFFSFLVLNATVCFWSCRRRYSNHQLLSWWIVLIQTQSWVVVFRGPSSFHLRLLFPSWSCPACAFMQADLLKWDYIRLYLNVCMSACLHLQGHPQLIVGVQKCFELLSSSFLSFWLWRCTKSLTLFTKSASTTNSFMKLRHYCFTLLLLFLFGARPDSKAGNCSIRILQWHGSFSWS